MSICEHLLHSVAHQNVEETDSSFVRCLVLQGPKARLCSPVVDVVQLVPQKEVKDQRKYKNY